MLRNFLNLRTMRKSLFSNASCLMKNEQPNYTQEDDVKERAMDNTTGITSETVTTKKAHFNPFVSSVPTVTSVEGPNTSDEERRLKVLKLELDMANQEGRRVPKLSFMQPHYWEHVLSLGTKSARNKYYSFLWSIEKKQESKLQRKNERSLEIIEYKEELRKQREECEHIIYGLGHTSLFLRIYDSTINLWQNNRLSRAMQFAPKIVLDCGYDKHMTRREAQNTAKQLMLCFAENRMHIDPLDLHFCNVDLESVSMQGLLRHIPTMLQPEFPINLHEKCFTDIFPREQLVYLTPHCRNDLTQFNPDDVYIIGAMVDTVNNEPLSLARAKRLGLRMAKLPLDRYLQWGSGSGKSLTLNQMVSILLDLRDSGDWTHALRHVPRRKIIDASVEDLNQRHNMQRRANKLNVRLDKVLNFDRDEQDLTVHKRALRDQKSGLQFNMDTWASNKKHK